LLTLEQSFILKQLCHLQPYTHQKPRYQNYRIFPNYTALSVNNRLKVDSVNLFFRFPTIFLLENFRLFLPFLSGKVSSGVEIIFPVCF
jgi:hypothetical protein